MHMRHDTVTGNLLLGFLCESCIFLRAKVRFVLFKVGIALIALFVKSDRTIRSHPSFKIETSAIRSFLGIQR